MEKAQFLIFYSMEGICWVFFFFAKLVAEKREKNHFDEILMENARRHI